LRAVKGEVVDHGPDDHALAHERLHRVADVVVMASQTIKRTNHQHVASPQLVEQAPATVPLGEASTDAGDPLILDDVVLVDVESGADSDEAGHPFRFEADHRSDLKSATWRHSGGSRRCCSCFLVWVKSAKHGVERTRCFGAARGPSR
jgi:hypothetical protein